MGHRIYKMTTKDYLIDITGWLFVFFGFTVSTLLAAVGFALLTQR